MPDDHDTLPPPPPVHMDEVLAEQTTRYVMLVGQIIDPVRAVLQRVCDDLLKMRYEVRTKLDAHEALILEQGKRIGALEIRLDDVERKLEGKE